MRIAHVVRSGHALRDFKYKLLGIAPVLRHAAYEQAAEWSETDTLQYLRQTRILAQSIIQQLSQMTDLSQPPSVLPRIRVAARVPIQDNQLESALISRDWDSPGALSLTIDQVTSHDYGPQATEKISHWLYALLRSGNRLSLTRASANTVMGYFLATNDLQMALYTLRKMLDHGVQPDRITLHLLLKYQARRVQQNPYPIGVSGHPLIGTQRCLQNMDQHGVRADATTWNYVLQCMPFGFGKSFLIEEMDKRGIALNSESRRAVLQTIIGYRQQREQQLRSLHEQGAGTPSASALAATLPPQLVESLDPNEPVVVQLLVDYMLSRKSADNDNVKRAWQFLMDSKLSDNDKKSTAMLNVFMRRFAARRHLDWQFGIMSWFHDTPWDATTWQYLLECASFCKSQPAKYVVVGTLLKQMQERCVPLTSRARYLARRALRAGHELRDLGPNGFAQIKKGLGWKSVLQPEAPELLATIGFSDGTGHSLQSEPLTGLDETRFAGMPRTDTPLRREQLEDFLRKVPC